MVPDPVVVLLLVNKTDDLTLQQLEYIVAVDTERHFARAAASCHVTQPTLSMMIRRLEEELDTQLFDRSRQPVVPTDTGEQVIAQARRVLREAQLLTELVHRERGAVSGDLTLGIIPTLAPYLVPRFVGQFLERYPQVRLKMSEMRTEAIVEGLKQGRLDAGILVTPLPDRGIEAEALFYEEFFAYASTPQAKGLLLPEDIDPNQLWLLEEGHCFRSQIMNLCELRRQAVVGFEYEAGSLETLKRLVDQQQGITILPELAVTQLTPPEAERLRAFAPPAPMREVSLVSHRPSLKRQVLTALARSIRAAVPPYMHEAARGRVVAVETGFPPTADPRREES